MTTNTAAQVTIYARDMLTAQGVTLSAEDRAHLKAKADKFRMITGTTAKTNIGVPVRDVYSNALIGRLDYML